MWQPKHNKKYTKPKLTIIHSTSVVLQMKAVEVTFMRLLEAIYEERLIFGLYALFACIILILIN